MPADIVLVPCLSDNYAVLLHDAASGTTALVDAPEAAPIAAVLEQRGWGLTHILITHKHADHINGLAELKSRFGAIAIGPAAEQAQIPGLDVTVAEGDVADVGPWRFAVIDTPGHTKGHVVFHEPSERWLFAGDTLFVMGCGRLFEDTPAAMWGSLKKLAALPDDTRVWCGHEYTLSNARFCAAVLPDDSAIATRLKTVEVAREAGEPTLPSTIADEKATNVFLRSAEPGVAEAVGLSGESAEKVFAALRERKNRG